MSTHARFGAASTTDPYLPGNGNGGYRVEHYDLELDYRLSSNRLAGRAGISAVTTAPLSRLSFDIANLRVAKAVVDGHRASKFAQRGRKVHVWLPKEIPAGRRLRVDLGYGGTPRPVSGPWGDVGWEELAEGVIVAGQPNGAPSWFPCNDHPSNKASYRISITTDSPYHVVANGTLVERHVHSSRTKWVYDQPEPMASYLATVQIGRYELRDVPSNRVNLRAALPPHLGKRFAVDFGRQAQMMKAFEELLGRYPFAGYTVVVTADELEIPLEAQGLSIFGANHLDGARGSERLIAHELAHQWFGNSLTLGTWQDIWLHEGFACYAEWLWSERSGGPPADRLARQHWERLHSLPQDLIVGDPGPALMFDDRLYKRGALALHAVRVAAGDGGFFGLLRSWSKAHRHATVTTQAFTDHVERICGSRTSGLLKPWLWKAALPAFPTRG